MIRRLRTRHRAISAILLLIVPPLLFLSLSERKSIPVMKSLLFEQQALSVPSGMNQLFSSNQLWQNLPVTTLVFAQADKYLLFLLPDKALPYPDLLLYWESVSEDSAERLSENASLLGPISGSSGGRFILDSSVIESEGRFVIYSLAHKKIISAANLSAQLIEEGVRP